MKTKCEKRFSNFFFSAPNMKKHDFGLNFALFSDFGSFIVELRIVFLEKYARIVPRGHGKTFQPLFAKSYFFLVEIENFEIWKSTQKSGFFHFFPNCDYKLENSNCKNAS